MITLDDIKKSLNESQGMFDPVTLQRLLIQTNIIQIENQYKIIELLEKDKTLSDNDKIKNEVIYKVKKRKGLVR
jgi:hypothetical protein